MGETTYALAGSLILLFLVRSIYRLLLPNAIDGDAVFHLHVIEDTRRNGNRVPEKVSQVATTGYFAYPYLMHWVLSCVPTRYVRLVERFFSPLSEVALMGVILLLLPLEVITLDQALLITLMLIATPHFMRPDMAHAIGMSARKPGMVLTTLSILIFLQWVVVGELLYLVAAFATGATIFLLSKFSVQAFLFLTIALAITTTPYALLLFVGALILAIMVSRGRYLKVLRVHFYYLEDYARHKQYKKLDQSLPNPLSFIQGLRNSRSIMDVFKLVHASKLRPLIDFPFVVSALMAIGWILLTESAVSLPIGYWTWIATGFFAMAVISLPHMLFLGKPERYLEYIFLPASVLIAYSWTTLGQEFQIAVFSVHLIGLVIIGVYVWGFKNVFFNQERFRSFHNIISKLNRKPPGTLIVHPSYLAKRAAWKSEHTVVDTIGNQASTRKAVEELNRLFPERYGYVTQDIDWLESAYDPDWVIFDLEKLAEHPDTGLKKPTTKPVLRNDRYEVYCFEKLLSS